MVAAIGQTSPQSLWRRDFVAKKASQSRQHFCDQLLKACVTRQRSQVAHEHRSDTLTLIKSIDDDEGLFRPGGAGQRYSVHRRQSLGVYPHRFPRRSIREVRLRARLDESLKSYI